jgi:hypothetical protein
VPQPLRHRVPLLHRRVVTSFTYEDGTDTVFRNTYIYSTDAGEPPKIKHMTFNTRQKFGIKVISSPAPPTSLPFMNPTQQQGLCS